MSMRRAYPEHSKGLAENISMQKLDHMIKPGTTAHTYIYIYITAHLPPSTARGFAEHSSMQNLDHMIKTSTTVYIYM
jgi:hypothetical protein